MKKHILKGMGIGLILFVIIISIGLIVSIDITPPQPIDINGTTYHITGYRDIGDGEFCIDLQEYSAFQPCITNISESGGQLVFNNESTQQLSIRIYDIRSALGEVPPRPYIPMPKIEPEEVVFENNVTFKGYISGGSPIKFQSEVRLIPQSRGDKYCDESMEGVLLYDKDMRDVFVCMMKKNGAYEWTSLTA